MSKNEKLLNLVLTFDEYTSFSYDSSYDEVFFPYASLVVLHLKDGDRLVSVPDHLYTMFVEHCNVNNLSFDIILN